MNCVGPDITDMVDWGSKPILYLPVSSVQLLIQGTERTTLSCAPQFHLPDMNEYDGANGSGRAFNKKYKKSTDVRFEAHPFGTHLGEQKE